MTEMEPSHSIQLSNLDFANRVDTGASFGLTAVRGYLSAEAEAPATVLVRVGEHAAEFAGSSVLVPERNGGWRVIANLCTHLLPNGPTSVEVELVWGDGMRLAFSPLPFRVENETPLAEVVAADLRAHGTPVILPRLVDSSHFPYAGGAARAPFDDACTEAVPLSFEQAPSLEAAHRHLEQWGFVVLPERLPAELIAGFRAELDGAIATKVLAYEAGTSSRIFNAHRLPTGRRVWLYPPVVDFLAAHFRDTPCACQTLTYVHGSEQGAHQDTIHLTPYPAGYMCGVWIALEDVSYGSGELFVYPGSHRTPRLRAAELGLEKVDEDYSSYGVFESAVHRYIEEGRYERVDYTPKAGQILVWHENLIHGGAPRRNREKTRTSIVSHYFAKGSVAYYDSRGEAAALELLPVRK
jgi:hypothetical protein